MQRRPRRGLVQILGAAAFAAQLGGCASSDTIGATVMADPLKYEFYDCKQLADTLRTQEAQEQKLRDLIAKAEQSTGGTVVATLAYKNDYAKVRADVKVLHDTQRRRDCIKQTDRDGIGAVH